MDLRAEKTDMDGPGRSDSYIYIQQANSRKVEALIEFSITKFNTL